MTPVEILKAARELIAKPERWTRGCMARDELGNHVGVDDPEATCWCALGAISKASCCKDDDEWWIAAIPAEEVVRRKIVALGFTMPAISSFNDSHDHAEVLALFDAAIASAQP